MKMSSWLGLGDCSWPKFVYSGQEFCGQFEYSFGSVQATRDIELHAPTQITRSCPQLAIPDSAGRYDCKFAVYAKFGVGLGTFGVNSGIYLPIYSPHSLPHKVHSFPTQTCSSNNMMHFFQRRTNFLLGKRGFNSCTLEFKEWQTFFGECKLGYAYGILEPIRSDSTDDVVESLIHMPQPKILVVVFVGAFRTNFAKIHRFFENLHDDTFSKRWMHFW